MGSTWGPQSQDAERVISGLSLRAVLKGGEKLLNQLPSLLDVVGKMRSGLEHQEERQREGEPGSVRIR